MTTPAEPFSRILARQVAEARPVLAFAFGQLFAQPDFEARFVAYLTEVYHWVSQTVPLVDAQCARLDPADPLRAAMRTKRAEEEGHDRWVLDDLEAFGQSAEAVRASLPRRETLALVGIQRHLIEAVDPVAHLGYVYVLESNAPTPEGLAQLEARLGRPLRSFAGHAELDPGHVASLEALLDALPLDAAQRRWITYSARITMEQLAELVLAVALP